MSVIPLYFFVTINKMTSVGLVFGINYHEMESHSLHGCINDAKNMTSLLKNTLKFDEVETYTDETDAYDVYGREIVRRIMSKIRDTHTRRITNLWIHFSGHATRKPDLDRDEEDGYDECIVPGDADRHGVLRDDFFLYAFSKVHESTQVICTFDCCHSGSITDLTFMYERREAPRVVSRTESISAKVITFSGCRDTEKSQERELSGNNVTGILTTSLLDILNQEGPFVKIFDLLDKVRASVRMHNPDQYPILTSSFEIEKNHTLLRIC